MERIVHPLAEKATKSQLGNNEFERHTLFAYRWVKKYGIENDSFHVSGEILAQIVEYLGQEDAEWVGKDDPMKLIGLGVNKLLAEKKLGGVSVAVEGDGDPSGSMPIQYQVTIARVEGQVDL